MRARHRPSICGVVGLGLLAVAGCGSKSASTDASGSTSLPTPSCGGSATVTGTVPTGYFNGDTVTVDATLGNDTSVTVFVADSASGALLSWQSAWPSADGGTANLQPIDEGNDATFTSTQGMSTLATMVPGTVDVTSATNPAEASTAGHGGQIQETVAFSSSGFQLSGTLTSPYCQITSSATRMVGVRRALAR